MSYLTNLYLEDEEPLSASDSEDEDDDANIINNDQEEITENSVIDSKFNSLSNN